MNLIKNILKKSVLYSFVRGVAVLESFLLIKILSNDGFGDVGKLFVAISFLSILAAVSRLGYDRLTLFGSHEGKESKLLSEGFSAAFLVSAFISLAYFVAVSNFDVGEQARSLPLYLMLIPFALNSLCVENFKREARYLEAALFQNTLLFAFVIVGYLTLPLSLLHILAVGVWLNFAISASVTLIRFGKKLRLRPNFSFSLFDANAYSVSVLSVFQVHFVNILSFFYLSFEATGVLNSVLKILQVIPFVLDALNSVFAATLKKLFKESRAVVKTETVKIGRMLMLTVLMLGALFLLFEGFLMRYFGLEGFDVGQIYMLLLIAYLFNVFTGPVGVGLQVYGHFRIIKWLNFSLLLVIALWVVMFNQKMDIFTITYLYAFYIIAINSIMSICLYRFEKITFAPFAIKS